MSNDKYNMDDNPSRKGVSSALNTEAARMSSEDHAEYDRSTGGAYYEIEDDPEENPERRDPDRKYLFGLLVKLLISPRVGWKEIRRTKLTGNMACIGLFYPLCGIAALSNFANLWFDPERTVTEEVINAVVTFSSFFFAYFLVFPFSRLLLKGKGAEIIGTEFGKTFVAYAMATLALFYTLYTLLPMLEPILVFLPLWTIFAITRGIKLLRIPEEDQTSATVWLSLLIVGLPIGVGYLFGLMLGS